MNPLQTKTENNKYDRLKKEVSHLAAEFDYVAQSIPVIKWEDKIINVREFSSNLLSSYMLFRHREIAEEKFRSTISTTLRGAGSSFEQLRIRAHEEWVKAIIEDCAEAVHYWKGVLDTLDGDIPGLQTPIGELERENVRLREWKESALDILNKWDDVWEAAGKPGRLGDLKSDAVRDFILWNQSDHRLRPGKG